MSALLSMGDIVANAAHHGRDCKNAASAPLECFPLMDSPYFRVALKVANVP